MSNSQKIVLRLPILFLLLAQADVLLADPADGEGGESSAASRFIRVKQDAQGPIALETAIVSYAAGSGEGELVVDLIGCVHVGSRSYYRKLNQRFENYDVVLYELVAPQGTRVPKGGGPSSGNPIAMFQDMTRDVLELESQMEHIDYTKENFVHADMSPTDMAQKMKERGDDGITLFLSIAADLLRQQNLAELERKKNPSKKAPPSTWETILLLFDSDRALKLRRVLAEQFGEAGSTGESLGNTLNTMLVEDRNEAAMQVFQKELVKGRKRIAIFYGAGHMADFQQRLIADFGLAPQGEEWLAAWDLRD